LPLGPHWSNEIISKWLFSWTNADHSISSETEEVEEMRVGVWFYGLATIVTGILDLVWRAFEASHQPIQSLGHIPAEPVLACLAGAWLVAAGMAILWPRTARAGAAGSAVIYVIFALLWVPRLFALAHKFGFGIGVIIFALGGLAGQIMFVSPAAIVYATTAVPDTVWRERAAIAARWMLGVPPILFGLGHLISLPAYARFFPHWLPFGLFWIVLTGIAFLLAGIAIVSGVRDVLAARLLALMLLVFEFTVEIPPVFVQPHSQGAWGGAVYNLTAIGACWIFAEFVASRRQTDRSELPVAERVVASW
jgi:uncharacterized membrane protein YphA (DoxX/SURF4 family)